MVVVVLEFVLSQPTRRVRAGAVGRGSVDDEVPAAVQQKPSPTAMGRVAQILVRGSGLAANQTQANLHTDSKIKMISE